MMILYIWTPAVRNGSTFRYSAVVCVRPGGGRTLPYALRLPPLVGAASAQGVRATARPLWSPSATCGGNGRCTSNPSVVGAWPGAGLALQNARNDIRLLAVDVVSAQLHATAWGLWGRYRQQQDGAATRVAVQWRATGLGLWRVPLAGSWLRVTSVVPRLLPRGRRASRMGRSRASGTPSHSRCQSATRVRA